MPRHTLDDYLSREQARQYLIGLGHTEDDRPTGRPSDDGEQLTAVQWRYRIDQGDIVPIELGTRRLGDTKLSVSSCFTKRMIKEYHDNRTPVTPTDAEVDGIMTFQEVAEAAGVSYDNIKKRITVRGQMEYKTIGKMSIVLKRDYKKWLETAVFRSRKNKGESK